MNIIDLFSGCGGMSLGFNMAGFKPIIANEIDDWAGDTYSYNHPNTNLLRNDIRNINWNSIVDKNTTHEIDGIIGGPPCQGFSLSGNRDPHDPRNSLFMEFVKCLKHFRPKFFVMENVPGILSMRTAQGKSVIEIILFECELAGFKATYSILNAATYGVPQLRERVFIIGLKKEFPYSKFNLFPSPEIKNVEDYITVDMAISDLPEIEAGEGEDFVDYSSITQNAYQEWARQGSNGVYNHVAMRHTKRLIERFKVIQPGQSVADVPHEHSALKRGNPLIKSGKVYGQNNMRVHGNWPAPTVAASFQSNFIHPHLNRNFTAREGARLQSFPDSYIFKGKRTTMSWEKNLSQYQQIGNAVPPLLARAIAISILKYFENIYSVKDDVSYKNIVQTSFL